MIKGDMRKAALLSTAEQLFFTKGYAATTINDILEKQHCSKGSFYHHFESKLDVLTALCRAHAERAHERYLKVSEGTAEPLEKLNLLLEASFPVQQAEQDLCALLMQLISTPEGEQVLSVLFSELRNRFFEEFSTLLEELEENGSAFLPVHRLPELVFGAYQIECRQALQLGAELAGGASLRENGASENLAAIRYLMERTLDLPFGSIRIAELGAFERTLSACASHVRAVNSGRP